MRYLLAILALGALVAVHELGHLLFARLFKLRVDQYALGFGPALLAFRRGATEYSLRAIPIGGYVRIHGMNPHEDLVAGDPTSYASLAPWKRLLVLFGGPLTNYLLAVAISCAVYVSGTHVPVPMTVGTVEPGSEAARALVRPGDVILTLDGVPVSGWSVFAERVAESPGQTLTLGLLRHGDIVMVQVKPRADERGLGRIGIRQQYVYKRHALGEAVINAFVHTERLAAEGLELAWRLVRGKPGVELAGPIAVVKATSDAAAEGEESFLRLLVALSVALAVFNILPLPSLDGGRMVFVALAAVTGREIPAVLETLIHFVGFLLIIALTVWVAFSDVRRLIGNRSILPSEPEPQPVAAPALSPDAGVPRPDAGPPQR